MLGFGIGHIPPVARFVENYIDLILLAAVVVSVVPALVHVFSTSRKAKRANAATNGDAPAQP
jgi:membrane-associated protein